MKKILITGENSYIGGMFTEWVAQWPDKYVVDEISVHGEEWKQTDFSTYDVIFHVAAIVHKKETKENINLYYKVNRDLAYEVAKKAKEDGISQLIFMSSMNVYGVDNGVITGETPCKPKTAYGKSKLEAEHLILKLQDDNFKIAIIRPPMVYGPNTVGNYVSLSKLAKLTPVFPKIDNKRSMLYIKNLNEFIRIVIDNNSKGLYFPQNYSYVNTSKLVCEINKANDTNVYLTKLFNPFLFFFMRVSIFKKVFGNLLYSEELSSFEYNYQVATFKESVIQSEKSNRK